VELHEIYADEQLYSLHITKIEYLKMIKTQLISLEWQMEGRGEIHFHCFKDEDVTRDGTKKTFYAMLLSVTKHFWSCSSQYSCRMKEETLTN
jgi:hypothetical protein